MELVAAELRIVEALENAPNGLRNGELQKRANLHPSNLSKFLKRLQTSGLVYRDPETRRYKPMPLSRTVSNTTEMDIITRDASKKLTLKLTSNADDIFWVGIFPIEASIYLSPEVSQMVNDLKKDTGDLNQAKDTVFRYAVRPVETLFERLFFYKFNSLAKDYFTALCQQDSGAKFWNTPISQMEKQPFAKMISILKEQYATIDSSRYNLSHLLDFNAAIVVKVWSQALANHSEDVKNRIAMNLLIDMERGLDGLAHLMGRKLIVMPLMAYLSLMAKTGLLSKEDFEQVCQAKSIEGLGRAVRRLAFRYYVKIYHEKPNMDTLRRIQQSVSELERRFDQTK